MQLLIFQAILYSLVLGLAIAPLSIRLARRLGLLDNPAASSHKIHAVATPRAGGITLVVATLLIGALMGVLSQPSIRAILLSSLVVFAFGIVDDIRPLNAFPKLIGQIIAAVLLMLGGVYVQFLHYPIADLALTLFWMVGVTNAYNLVDSMDGLAVGLAIFASGFFLLATLDVNQLGLTIFAAILLGACAAVSYYNITPARLFLGDSGAQVLGFWLAALGIIYTPNRDVPQLSSWFVPILFMLVPIFDTTLVTVSRLRRRVPIYEARLDHTYHRIVAMGMPPLQAVFTIHLASVVCSCVALIALELPPLWANTVFVVMLLAAFAVLTWLGSLQTPQVEGRG